MNNMLVIALIKFFIRFIWYLISIGVFYFLVFFMLVLRFLIVLPFIFVNFIYSSCCVILFHLFRLCSYLWTKFMGVLYFLWLYYVVEAFTQFYNHICAFGVIFNKILKWINFYKRLYYYIGDLSVLFSLLLKVEPHSLLIANAVQLLKEGWKELIGLYYGRSERAYNFRYMRRVIKFIVGLLTLFYPISVFTKFFFWYLTRLLFFVIKLLYKNGFLTNKNRIKRILSFIIWLKIIFVWRALPFEFLFKHGRSKKYPQFKDIQPDLRVVKASVWDYALSHYCYFDERRPYNSLYLFNKFNAPSTLLFSILGLFIIVPFLILSNISQILGTILMVLYLVFVFFGPFLTLLDLFILSFKLPIIILYLVPVIVLFLISILLYFFYRLFKVNYVTSYSSRFFRFVNLNLINLKLFIKPIIGKHSAVLLYVLFKCKEIIYSFNKDKLRWLISLDGLFKLTRFLNSLLNKLTGLAHLNTIMLDASSFTYKRIRAYLLRFKNVQFLNNFMKSNNTFRLTPDQIKAFTKIAINNNYPVYYFEKLFYSVYSKGEQELETPYYWAFVRQSFSINQYVLSPQFHVYGFMNFLKFFWNYFSFLSNRSLINLSSSEFQEFVQLLSSSLTSILGYLLNDFFILTRVKVLHYYFDRAVGFIKLSFNTTSTILYLFHPQYYHKLFTFYWYYLEPPLIKLIFFYYSILSNFQSIRIYVILQEYLFSVWYSILWSSATIFDYIMGELFYNSNRFEQFYEMNFDKSRDKYDFYLLQLKRFFKNFAKNRSLLKKSVNSHKLSDLQQEKLRRVAGLKRFKDQLASPKYKDYVSNTYMFFSGSFRIWGYFYLFIRDNVFEAIGRLYAFWVDVRSSYADSWASRKRIQSIAFYFIKTFLLIWLYLIIVLLFAIFYFAKFIIVKIIKKN